MTSYVCATGCSRDDELDRRWKKGVRWQITSELQLAELTVKLTSWTDPTRTWTSGNWADKLHLSWHITAKLTHCNQTWQADKTQWSWQSAAGQISCKWGESWQLMQHVELIWKIYLNWKFAAELTMCSWADKLHVSQLVAAELTKCSWAELVYGSWAELKYHSWGKLIFTALVSLAAVC